MIRSSVTYGREVSKDYPKLMQAPSGMILLAIEENIVDGQVVLTGTVIKSGNILTIGTHRTDFSKILFSELARDSKVTLTQGDI